MVDTTALGTVDIYSTIATMLGVSVEAAIWILTFVSLWALVWKGFALWKSSRRKQPVWFVILLITNTLGIFPILYLLISGYIDKKNIEKSKVIKKKSVKKKR